MGAGVLIWDDNESLIAALSCKGKAIWIWRRQNLHQLSKLLIFWDRCKRYHLRGKFSLACVADNFDPRRKIIYDWELYMVETTILTISIISGHKEKFILNNIVFL